MALLKKLCSIGISIALGLIFIYSGYAKLFPVIETFEFSFVDLGIANWYTAPVIARLLIGVEFLTGILLIANFRLRQFTIPAAAILLSLFVIYLSYLLVTVGNKGSCGCFGEQIPMSPLNGLIKNILMLGGCFVVWKWEQGWSVRHHRVLLAFLALVSLTSVFVLNPIDYAYTSNNLDEKVNYRLDLDLLYENRDSAKVERPKTELRKGKHVIAFLSLTCAHCRIAAKKFRIIKKENPELPIYFILNGDREVLPIFLDDTRATSIPYSFCLGKTFVQLASTNLPRIYYVDESVVVKKVDYFELSQYDIETWLSAPPGR